MKRLTKKELRRQKQELAQKNYIIDKLRKETQRSYNGTPSNRQRLAKYLLELPAGTVFDNRHIRQATGMTQRQVTDAKRNPYIRNALKIMQIERNPWGQWKKIDYPELREV